MARNRNKVINVVTLGCAKNLVDSEHLMARLERGGYSIVADSDDVSEAGVVVINTCGFIADAKEESVNTILSFADARRRGLISKLFVIGCLSERYADELRQEIPEVDEYFGVRDMLGVVDRLDASSDADLSVRRHLTTPGHYAYLKISEGCNWHCAYCAIPLIRGHHVSVPEETVIREAEILAGRGVRELIVVAQDTTYYGMDLYGERRLAHLLTRLCRIDGIEWVRLHYTYPSGFPQDVIDVMAREPKICKYIDIPLQHISDSQLSLMRRRIDRKETERLLDTLRARIPGIAVRTTLMTGFPGETEEDFAQLEEFVREQRFDRLGVFTYSEEEGTPAALMKDDVPEEVKRSRMERLMALQSSIAEQHNLERVGKVMRVIMDGREGGWWVGRTQYDSPEVDQNVLVRPFRGVTPGRFFNVRIVSVAGFDMFAEPVFG